jgi:hypothetical protein
MDYILTDYDPNNNQQCLRYLTCSGRTSRSPYCANCLFADWGVGIGPSFLFDEEGKRAGLGLFALRTFRKGDLICYYSGRKVNDNKIKETNQYCMTIGKKQSIDAQDPYSCIGRYINGSSTKLKIKANAKSWRIKANRKKKNKEERNDDNNNNNNDYHGIKRIAGRPFNPGQIEIYSTKEIKEGEEIFICYGSGYWNAQRRVKRKRDKEEIEQQKKVRLPHQPNFTKLRFTRSDIV